MPLRLVLLFVFLLNASVLHAAPVKTGADVLADSGFSPFAGKNVGLIVNHTSLVHGKHLADLLHASHTGRIAALFSPEHGLRGEAEDGANIAGGVDAATGATLFSLYGKEKQPTPEMLKGVDLLVFDIQDVGARFYTYISTMGLAMQAAAKAGIPFVVLDRPNPLGGDYVSGFIMERKLSCFTGLFPIPIAHGMTAGELAQMIKGERMLPGLEKLDLRVVTMEGWKREMRWDDTGLPWKATSPNIPDPLTALRYPGACLLEGTAVSEGRGTREPFALSGVPGLNGDAIATELNEEKLPGVSFEGTVYRPISIPGMSSRPKFEGKKVNGVRMRIVDDERFQPVETGVALLVDLYRHCDPGLKSRFFRLPGFDVLAGSARLRTMVVAGKSDAEIIASWQEEVRLFKERRKPYLLY